MMPSYWNVYLIACRLQCNSYLSVLFSGTASVARGLSSYLDALIGNAISKWLRSIMPIHVDFLSEYPDFFAFAVVILLIVLLSVGVKESSMLNNVFTVVNLITIMIIIVAGAIKGNDCARYVEMHRTRFNAPI